MQTHHLRRAVPFAALLALSLPLGAAVFYWDTNGNTSGTGGSGTWSIVGNTNFRSGSANGALVDWPNGNPNADEVVFGGTAGTVRLSQFFTIYANKLTFTTTGYVLENRDDSSSQLTLSGTTPTITVNSGVTVTSTANITGTSATLAGGGTFLLGASDRIANTMALSITGGSTLALGNFNETLANITLVSGSITGGTGVLQSTGTLDLQSGSVSAILGGTSAVNKTTAGNVTLSGANTYTGGTNINAGTLTLGAGNVLANTGAVTLNGGTLAMGGFSETVGAVTLNSGTINGGGTLTSGSGFTVNSGTISTTLAGAVGLTKGTAGTVTFSGISNYTGATAIQAGTFINSGTMNGTAITVASGAIFGGSGTATGAVTVNGRLAPAGASGPIGTLSTGGETWNGGGSLSIDLNNATGVAGTNWDRLGLSSALNIAATSGSTFMIDLNGLDGTGSLGVVSNFSPSSSYSWTIVNASNIVGFAGNKFTIDTTDFASNNAFSGTFSLAATSNTLSLVYTPIPEPRVYALILGAGTLGIVGLRRLRRREHVQG